MSAPDKASALRARKGSASPIAALTAWDYPTARLLDEAGTDLILVGDSLGMVVLGFPDTTHVTMEHMLHHTAAAARGNRNALLVADFAIHSYEAAAQAVENARALVAAGAEAGGCWAGRSPSSLVYVLPVSNLDDLNQQPAGKHVIKDPIIPDPNPVAPLASR